jgi:serine phosphatase RsbU (regulator of sigma subunit)
LRTLALTALDVGDILTRANRVLAEDIDVERFVTMIMAKLDPRSQELVYTSAGHPNGYVFDAAGELKAVLQHTGVPLGFQRGSAYRAAPAVPLRAGDVVLLLTDGIEEAISPEDVFFGVQRILAVARANLNRTAREILEALFGAVRDFSEDRPQLDDLTVVVVKVNSAA